MKTAIKFGEYLLSKEREEMLRQSDEIPGTLPYEERKRNVYHADIENFKELSQ